MPNGDPKKYKTPSGVVVTEQEIRDKYGDRADKIMSSFQLITDEPSVAESTPEIFLTPNGKEVTKEQLQEKYGDRWESVVDFVKKKDPTGSVSADGGLELRDTRNADYEFIEEPSKIQEVPAHGKLGDEPLPEDQQGTVKIPNTEYAQQLEAYERQLKDQKHTEGLIAQERVELEADLPNLTGKARKRAIRQLYDKGEATYDAEQQAIKDAEAWAKESGESYIPSDTREEGYEPIKETSRMVDTPVGSTRGDLPLTKEQIRRNELDKEWTEVLKSRENADYSAKTLQREAQREQLQSESIQRRRAELQKEEGFVKDIAAVTAEDMDLTEEAGQKRLNDLYGKYGFLFEQIGTGDALLVTAEDGSSHEIDLQPLGIPIIGKTLKATKNELQEFINDNAMPAIEPVAETKEEMSFLKKAYKANTIRDVAMKNEDGSSSTHLMAAEVIDGKWVAFPTLFPITQKTRQKPVDIAGGGIMSAGGTEVYDFEATSNPNDWMEFDESERMEAYEEALKRGEVFEFDTKEEALAFGEGSWKNADISEYGLYKFMKDNGVDGEVYLDRYREYNAAHDELEFIESEPPLRVGYLSKEDKEKYGEKYYGEDGKLRNDYQDFIPEIEEEISAGRSVVTDEQFMELRGDYDAQTEQLRLKASVEASNLNKEVDLGLEAFNEKSLEMFGVPLGEILDVVPTTQEEVDVINSIINESQSLLAVQRQAATQYELSENFLHAKFNKDASAHLLDNMEAFANALQTGWKRGQALDEIMLGALGIDDLSDDATREEKAAAIVKYLEGADTGMASRQSENYNTSRGFIDTWRAFIKNPYEMSATVIVESVMQMAPHGLKAAPILVGAGAGVGALAGGPAGAVYGAGKGTQTTMAYLGFVMEYGNAAIDAIVNQGYDITDPKSVEKALQDEKVWDEAWEVGAARGAVIGSLDFLTGFGVGKFVKAAGPTASRLRKVAIAAGETFVFDPSADAFGEFSAQALVDKEIKGKEIGMEAMGGVASNTSLRVLNLTADAMNRDTKEMVIKLGALGELSEAEDRTLPTTEGTEQLSDPAPTNQRDEAPKRMTRKPPPILSRKFYDISDKDLSSFINRQLKRGRVSDQQAQEALVNVGIRGEVKDILGNDAPLSEQSEIFHLLAEKKQLEANPAKKTANQGRIGEITTRIQEITNEVTIKEQVADANAARRKQLEDIINEPNIIAVPFGLSEAEYKKAQKDTADQVKRKEEARKELAKLDIDRPRLWDMNRLYKREFDSEESIPSELRELESVERVVGDDGKITLSFTGQQLSDADIIKTEDYAIQEPSTEEVGQDVKAEEEETTSSSDDIIDRAREGDIEAQETLKKYRIEWEKQSTYRFIGESEVEALEKGETIKGKSEQAGVDITTSEDVTTATDADYRVTFKEEGFDNKKEDSRVRMKNDKDGWIPKGYDKSDVAKIEKINADGTYETVYEAEVEVEGEEAALEVTEESLAEGKQELVEIEEGKTTITKPVKIFKGIGGKKDVDGNSISAHKGVEGVFSTTEEAIADQYGVDEGVSEVVLPEGTTVEVVEVEAKGMTVGEVRAAEVEAINNSDAQVVKLKTLDGRIPKGQTRNVQYVIKDEALIEQLSKPSVEEQQDESTQGFMAEELDLNNPEDLTTFEESMDALINDVSVDDETDPVQNKKKKKAEEKITKDTKVKEKSKKLAQEILKNAEKYKAFIAEVGDSATDMANFIAVATTDYINGKTNEIVEKYDEVKKKIQKIVRDFKTAVMFSLAVLGASDNIIQVSKTADAYIQEVVIPEIELLPDYIQGFPDYIERALVKHGGLDVEESVAPEVEEEIVEAKVEETGETTITLPQNEIHNIIPEKRDGGGVMLSQHSSYFDNEDGFVYNPIPTKGNKKAPQKVDGAATAHFFILDERPSDFKDIYDADQKELQRQSEWFKNRREFKSANDSDFFPVFTKLEDGNVQVKYKRKGEITSEDAVIQKLVQHKAGNIDFEKTQQAGDQYKGKKGSKLAREYKDYKVLVTKDGKGIQSVIFKDENLYSKFSGAAGLFIAETPDGKRYVKDFAGSVKNMKDGLKSFAEITGVNQDDITIAFYDSGSVTAKPVGKDGKINRRDSQYFNNKGISVSGLALPVGFDTKEKDQVVEKPVLKPSEDAPTIPKSSTFDSFIESLDSAIEAIDESTKGTLGINIAPATLKAALQLIKQTAIATKSIAKGIKAGIDFIRKSEWYKNLSKDKKAELTDEKIKEQFGIDPPSKERVEDIIKQIVDKTRKRNVGKNTSPKKIKENVLSYLQQTRWYEEASDIQREEAVQKILEELGEKRKKAPSVAKILGKIKDVKKITISEKVLLRNRLKALNEGAKNVLAAQKEAKKQLMAAIKELESSGKISMKQMSSVINRFAKVNLLSDASIDSFVDYMAKVFADAEYAEKMEKANKLRARAKKNVKNKIGVANAIADQLTQVFSIKPTFIPDSVLDSYLELLDMFGGSKAILNPKDIDAVNDMVQDILRVMDEEHSMVESLAEKFDNYSDVVVKEDGSIDYSATVKKMQDEGLIDEGDAVIMRKYKNDIAPKKPKVELTEEEIQEQKDELIEGIAKGTQDSSIFPSADERKLAERFYNLINDIKNLEGLSVKDLERIQALLETMENGYLPHFVDVMVNKMEGKNDGNILSEAIKKAKMIPFSKLYANIRAIAKDAKEGVRKAIERTPLVYIDRLFGNFKTQEIFDTIFRKSAKAYESYVIDLRRITDRVAKAENAVIKSFNRNPTKILLSKFKQQVYLIQKEYESNKGNKEVNPAHKSLEATILAIRNGEVEFYTDKDADLLQQILDKFTNEDTGEIDIDRLYKSFNFAERSSIKVVQENNQFLQEKAVYTAGVIRGQRISPRDNYVHLNTLRKKGSSESVELNDLKDRYKGSTKSQVLQERTGSVSPLNFDVYASSIRGSKSVLMDYHLTDPIRQAKTALAQAKENLKGEDGVMPKDARDILSAIEDSYDKVIDNILNTAHQQSQWYDDLVNHIKKSGYRAVLASTTRVAAELTSNLGFVLLSSPVAFVDGVKIINSKVESPIDVMFNLNSANTNRLYPEGLSGKLVDQGAIDQKQGSKGGRARGAFVSRLIQMYESTGGRVTEGVGKIADVMISTPDKAVMRPMWFGSFKSKFKELTGTDPDFKKIQANDEAYMRDNKEALDKATDFADEMSVMTGSTTNPFMGLLKTANDADAGAIKKALNTFNNYMTTFLIFEYHTAVKGIYEAMGNGSLGRLKGLQLLAGVSTRMVMYLFIGQILRQELNKALGWGDEDEELSTEDLLSKSMVSAFSSLIVSRDFGQGMRILTNLGLEYTNEEYFEFLRDGEEYDYYRDAIAYTLLPRDADSRGSDIGDVLKAATGPYGSMVKTVDLAIRKGTQDEPTEEEAKERRNREIYQRLLLEVAGNLGFVPFYNDVRKMLLASIYDPLRKSLKFKEEKKAYKEKWIRYFNGGKDDEGKDLTVSSAKKYDKQLWKDVFGDDSVWMIKYNRERWEKELLEK